MLESNEFISVFPQNLISQHEDIEFQLNPNIKLKFSQDGISGFDSHWRTIEFQPEVSQLLNNIFPSLDETYSLQELQRKYPSLKEGLLTILQFLYEFGFLFIRTSIPISAISFYKHLTSIARSYKAQMKEKSLTKIQTSNDPETLRNNLVGKLLSLYFLLSEFPSHLSAAISQTNIQELNYKLSHHLSAEYWSPHMLKSGLLHLGYTLEAINELKPTPPILGMLNLLRVLARTDLLSYGACLSLMEFPSVSRDKLEIVELEWSKIEALDLVPVKALEPFKQHQFKNFIDFHGLISEDFFKHASPLGPALQQQIKENAYIFVECQVDALTRIDTHYNNI